MGTRHEVLIDSNKHQPHHSFSEGRSDSNRLVRLDGEFIDIGSLVLVEITQSRGGALYGRLCQ